MTVGCSAALTHATAACVAGGQPRPPRAHPEPRRLPEGRGRSSPSTRATSTTPPCARVGVRVIEVTTPRGAGGRAWARATALVYILAGPRRTRARSNTKVDRRHRAGRGACPVLVDAAAEILTVPNVHLQNGATLVAYSGGKCLARPAGRGPAPRAQGPREGGLGPQRAPSRLLRAAQGRQGRSDQDAHGGRRCG